MPCFWEVVCDRLLMHTVSTAIPDRPRDCFDIYNSGAPGTRSDGVYTVYIDNRSLPIEVYCNMTTDGGGWTVCILCIITTRTKVVWQ